MKKILRYTFGTLGIILLLPLLVVFLLYLPPVQSLVKDKALAFASERTGMTLEAGYFRLGFPLNLTLKDVYVGKTPTDTLVALDGLRLKVGMRDILQFRATVEELELERVKFALANDSTGLDLSVDMGSVALSVRKADLKSKEVDVAFIRLADGEVALKTGNRSREETKERRPLKWTFAVDRIDMEQLAYRMKTATLPALGAGLMDGFVTRGKVSLDAQTVHVDSVAISGAWCDMQLANRETQENTEVADSDTTASLPWTVRAGTVALDNSAFDMEREGMPQAMLALSGIGVRIDSVFNQKTRVRARLKDVWAVQKDGAALTSMQANVVLDSTESSLHEGYIRTANSRLRLEVQTRSDVRNLISSNPLAVVLSGKVGLRDVLPFYPGVPEEIQDKQMDINTSLALTEEKVQVGQLILELPEHFKLTGSGSLMHYTDVRRMDGNFVLRGEMPDVAFLRSYLGDKGVQVPRGMDMLAKLYIRRGDCRANVRLCCQEGCMSLDGSYHLDKQSYDAALALKHFPVHRFLPSDSLGLATVDVRLSGRSFDWSKARADVDVYVEELDYRNHTYEEVSLSADLNRTRLQGILMSRDKAAPLALMFRGDSVGTMYNMALSGQIGAIDMHELHFMPEPFTVGTGIALQASMGAQDSYGLKLRLDSLAMTSEGQHYDLGDLELNMQSDWRKTLLELVSGDLTLDFQADTSLKDFVASLGAVAKVAQRQIANRHVDMEELKDALSPFSLNILGADKNAITRFLQLRNIGFRYIAFGMVMRERSGLRFGLTMNKPHAGTISLDSLQFGAWQTGRSLMYSLMSNSSGESWKGLFNIVMTGRMHGERFRTELKQKDAEGLTGVELGINTVMGDSTLTVSFFPTDPILGYNRWQLNADNYVEIGKHGRIQADLSMAYEDKSVHIQSLPDEGERTDRLQATLAGLDLAPMTGLLPFMPELGGVLGMDLQLYTLDRQMGVEGNIGIRDFAYEHQPVGTLDLGVDYLAGESFTHHAADLELCIDSVYRTFVRGEFSTAKEEPLLAVDVDLPAFPLRVANAFLPSDLMKLDGALTGGVRLRGTLEKPQVDGALAFRDGRADVVMLGTEFRMDTLPLAVKDGKLHFENYRFLAPNNSGMVLNGDIALTPFDRMNMDLALDARNFEAVNVGKNKTSLIYGKAYADIHARLAGPFSSLKVTGDVNLLNSTNITYTLRSSGPSLEDRSVDLVRFVTFQDSTQTEEAMQAGRLSAGGFSMSMQVEIGDQVSVGVDLSDNGANHVSILGGGNLLLAMSPESGMTLSGKYILSGGTVEYNVPIVGKKEFNIQSGSYVEWTGNVMTPQLNIAAAEQVKADVEDGDQSRQVVFESIIRIQNNLMHPDVTFDLSAPNDMVIQNQLTTFSAEERTRQALNLLIYNTYNAPGAAESNANAKMANNALYSLVENELNKYTRRAGLTVGFDSRATTENVTRTDVTYEFSRQLFNDRVSVKIGGRISTDGNEGEGSGSLENNLVDDISIEYALTKRRNLFARVFRHSSYEVLDGDVVETGGGFVWRKSFRKFKDLFKNKNREERRAAKALREAENARREE